MPGTWSGSRHGTSGLGEALRHPSLIHVRFWAQRWRRSVGSRCALSVGMQVRHGLVRSEISNVQGTTACLAVHETGQRKPSAALLSVVPTITRETCRAHGHHREV